MLYYTRGALVEREGGGGGWRGRVEGEGGEGGWKGRDESLLHAVASTIIISKPCSKILLCLYKPAATDCEQIFLRDTLIFEKPLILYNYYIIL